MNELQIFNNKESKINTKLTLCTGGVTPQIFRTSTLLDQNTVTDKTRTLLKIDI